MSTVDGHSRTRGNVNRQSTVDAAPDALTPDVPARHRFRAVAVARVVPETADAVSLVLDIPPDDASAFRYRPGQFVTLRVTVDGEQHVRSYSMSSTPGIDPDLRITVKQVAGGVVSTWIHDELRAGDRVEVMPPAGTFVVDGSRDVVAFAAGSGITPVFSIVKAVLAEGGPHVVLHYANQDRASTIFAAELDALAERHPDRFELRHHHDVDLGFTTPDHVVEIASHHRDADHLVCGPPGFMDVVEGALVATGIDPGAIHLERFTPADRGTVDVEQQVGDGPDDPEAPARGDQPVEVTIRMGRERVTAPYRPGTTILQAARVAGLRAPSSCETGSCATCMARVTEGRVEMRNNEALTPDEVDEGWVLTCQSVPITTTVTVEYE